MQRLNLDHWRSGRVTDMTALCDPLPLVRLSLASAIRTARMCAMKAVRTSGSASKDGTSPTLGGLRPATSP